MQALQNGQLDGLVVDLPTAFYITAAQLDDGAIVGQLPAGSGTPDQFGMVLAKGSPLTDLRERGGGRAGGRRHLGAARAQWLAGTDGAPVLS